MSDRTVGDLEIGRVRVITGADRGRYPHGNSLLVRGTEETSLIDPALDLVERRADCDGVDRLLHSHCHEDHVAGSHLFPEAAWHFHEADLPGIRSLDAFMDIYGFEGEADRSWRARVTEFFHFVPCDEPVPFRDGDLFDLGRCEVRVLHLPGHTRGHCVFHVLPDDVLFLGDIDLSSFGPYYGDAWSDLEDFERSLERVLEVRAGHYATFHHIGVVDHATFAERMGIFRGKIASREAALLEFLSEPRTLEDVVAHRFVFRPQDRLVYADSGERRSMGQHIARLLAQGRIEEVESGRFLAR